MSWIKTGKLVVNGTTSASLDNCFSATYKHYMIIGITDQRGGASSSEHRLRLRAGGSDSTSGVYNRQRMIATTGVSGNRATGETVWTALPMGGAYEGDHSVIMISHPFQARPTVGFTRPTLDAGGAAIEQWNMTITHNASTSYDGITVLSDADNIYGTYYVYGLKESA